ncbi:WD40 repeat-like protein, partial [Imleria badia]
DDKTMRIWNLEYGEEEATPMDKYFGDVMCLAFVSDGSRLARGARDSAGFKIFTTIHCWNSAVGIQVWKWTGHKRAVSKISLSPNGRVLASASYDHTVRFWDANRVITGQPIAVCAPCFSPSGEYVASSGNDRKVYVWRA